MSQQDVVVEQESVERYLRWFESDPAALREMVDAPEDASTEPKVMFPLRWYEAFLAEIQRRGIEVLTYADLFRDSDDWDFESNYVREFKNWHKSVRDPKKTYLVIQHDVDDLPFFTERMIALEHQYGFRSNIFIFRDRFRFGHDQAPYPVNHAFLQAAERHGFVIGYHQNAFQLAGFDMDKAKVRYESDLDWLSKMYDIRFMVPHGGRGLEVNGRKFHNFDVPIPAAYAKKIRWVYNRYGLKYKSRFSDGGLRKSRDRKRMAASDLVGAFLRNLKPGTRNFCLIHPQRWGYNIDMQRNPMLAEQPWYQKMCREYGGANCR